MYTVLGKVGQEFKGKIRYYYHCITVGYEEYYYKLMQQKMDI